MIRPFCILLLLCSFSAAQVAPSKTHPTPAKPSQTTKKSEAPAQKPTEKNPAPPNPPTAPPVGPDDTVITVPGVCAANVAAEACVTKLSRAEFEKLMSATNSNSSTDARKVATVYSQILAMANQAQKMGVDKDPAVQIQLHIQNLSLLAQAMQKKVFESSKPTPQEVESYYTENSAKYEEINLRRIVVLKSAGTDVTPEQQRAAADQIRARAVAGEDPDKLEIDAYKATKSPGTPPSTSLGWKKRGGIDPRHEPQILPLHAGEVSPVMEDGQAYYIYKVESKRLVPMQSVEKEIENTVQVERTKKALQQMMEASKPQFNEAYFSGLEQSKMPPTAPPK